MFSAAASKWVSFEVTLGPITQGLHRRVKSVYKSEDSTMPIMKQLFTQLSVELKQGRLGTPGKQFCTTRELAEQCNVSLLTAHRVVRGLAGEGLLRRSGRNMVLTEACRHERRLKKIGVLVTNLDNPFFSSLLNALELAGRRNGIEVISAGSNYDVDCEKRQLTMLAESGADGFLICPVGHQSTDNLKSLDFPKVFIGRTLAEVDADTVSLNNFEAGRLAAEHLLAERCRVFFYIGLALEENDMRGIGFAARLREAGVELPASHWLKMEVAPNDEELNQFIHSLRHDQKNGVFCYHDLFALRAMRAARLSELAIPQNVAVVGCDNLPIASETWPPLSSVGYPIDRMADRAVDILLERTLEKRRTSAVCYIEPTLFIRGSSSISGTSILAGTI